MNEAQMRQLGYQIIDEIVAHHLDLPHKRVYNESSYDQLLAEIPQAIPKEGTAPREIFAELTHVLNQHMVHTDHPRFFAFIPSPSNYLSVLAESLAIGYNVFNGHWLAGSGPAMIEATTIKWLGELFGFPASSGGIFTSGGSMANLTAIAAARHFHLGEDFSKGTIYYSAQTHSSMAKGLRVLGFRPAQLRQIPPNDRFQIDLPSLQAQIAADRAGGWQPFCVVGNAGTTNTGAIDPLDQIADLAAKEHLWFHVDGAYGAAAILADDYKPLLKGIERVDSLTLDPHKWWFQPYETGCLLVRDRLHLKQTFQVKAEYLDDTQRDDGAINFYDYGVQLTRSFRAIKLYTYFRCVGVNQMKDDVTQGILLAEYIEHLLSQETHWELISPASLGIVAFRVKLAADEATNDQFNQRLSSYVLEQGYAMITTTTLNHRVALRMCPIHPRLTKGDLDQTFAYMNTFIATHLKPSSVS